MPIVLELFCNSNCFYYLIIIQIIEAVIQRSSVNKVFLEISQNSQESACTRVSLLIKRLWQRCFPVNFVKFIRTSFFIEHPWWLLLKLTRVPFIAKYLSLSLSVSTVQLCTKTLL